MKSHRNLSCFALLLAITVLLSSCGGGTTSGTIDSDPKPESSAADTDSNPESGTVDSDSSLNGFSESSMDDDDPEPESSSVDANTDSASTLDKLKDIITSDETKKFASDVAGAVVDGAQNFTAKAADGISQAVDAYEEKKQAEADEWAADIFSVLFHQWYLDDTGIKVQYQSDRIAMGKKIRSAMEKKPVNILEQKGGLFEKNYLGVTMNQNTEYLYYGKTKDNRPNGFGVVVTNIVDPDDITTLGYLVYAGNFKEGRFDGYGALFAQQAEALYRNNYAVEELAKLFYQEGFLDDNNGEMPALAYLCSYVMADGNWSKGEMDGKMNLFDICLNYESEEGFWGGVCYPNIAVTNTKNGSQSGDTKLYESGILVYDGEMKNNSYNGKGTSYYSNGQKQYDGEWKNGKYNGTGTLYDENGTKIYKGKWENGDYAS